MRPIRRRPWLAYLWASPNTALGLLGVLVAMSSGGHVAVVNGVIEASGGMLTTLLRGSFFLPRGVLAMALGHVILGATPELVRRTRSHELVHVEQAERFGPAFIPLYLCSSVWASLRGADPYFDNVFEREAYARDAGIELGPARPRAHGD